MCLCKKISCQAIAPCLAVLLLASGCATNAVTGKKELRFIPESQEIALGAKQYAPMQQMQGGEQITFPEVADYVADVGHKLAAVSDRPDFNYEFVVLNNPVPNAWALPGGKIAVNRGLLTELDSEAELAAVLGHEIVHAAARHGGQGMQRGILLQGALALAGAALQNHDYRDILIGAGGMSAHLIHQKYGRDAERESDEHGIKYMATAGYDVSQAVELQKTFVRLSQESGRGNAGWLAGLFASHPPSIERVKANELTIQNYEPGGFVGREEYQRVMRKLREAEPAYDKMEEGYKALQEKRPKQALSLAKQAMRLQPQEAHFYGLSAKARSELRDYRGAVADLDQAIALNSEYFDFYLQRGLIQKKIGRTGSARVDLARSAELLPTGEAHEALGVLALQAGQTRQALTHLRSAASAPSEAGLSARKLLARLELPSQPQRYLQARVARDNRGMLSVRIVNQSPLAVRNVRFTVMVVDGQGSVVIQGTHDHSADHTLRRLQRRPHPYWPISVG